MEIEPHLPLVKTIAGGIHRRYWRCVSLDDLEQAGAMGLIEAASRWAPQGTIPFGVYAAGRIRGACIDELRKSNLVGSGRTPCYRIPLDTGAYSTEPDIGQWARLSLALRHLTRKQAELIRLHYWEDVPLVEIGHRWGTNKDYMRVLHHRAITNLRRRML